VVSATQITATTPPHKPGGVNIVVTNPGGQSGTLANGFTFVALTPVVTSVSPNTGTTAGGTRVTLTGKNFVSGAKVTFGGPAATSVVVVSATQITATTPPHKPGGVNIVVTNPGGQSGTLASAFTYQKPK
jgi:IPT/TIG domain